MVIRPDQRSPAPCVAGCGRLDPSHAAILPFPGVRCRAPKSAGGHRVRTVFAGRARRHGARPKNTVSARCCRAPVVSTLGAGTARDGGRPSCGGRVEEAGETRGGVGRRRLPGRPSDVLLAPPPSWRGCGRRAFRSCSARAGPGRTRAAPRGPPGVRPVHRGERRRHLRAGRDLPVPTDRGGSPRGVRRHRDWPAAPPGAAGAALDRRSCRRGHHHVQRHVGAARRDRVRPVARRREARQAARVRRAVPPRRSGRRRPGRSCSARCDRPGFAARTAAATIT